MLSRLLSASGEVNFKIEDIDHIVIFGDKLYSVIHEAVPNCSDFLFPSDIPEYIEAFGCVFCLNVCKEFVAHLTTPVLPGLMSVKIQNTQTSADILRKT